MFLVIWRTKSNGDFQTYYRSFSDREQASKVLTNVVNSDRMDEAHMLSFDLANAEISWHRP